MAKIVSESITNFNHHYPKIALIVTASARGKEGAMPAAWHSSICIKPPIYGVSLASSRFTYQLIAESKEFGLNFIPWEKANLAGYLGADFYATQDGASTHYVKRGL